MRYLVEKSKENIGLYSIILLDVRIQCYDRRFFTSSTCMSNMLAIKRATISSRSANDSGSNSSGFAYDEIVPDLMLELF